MFLNFNPTFPKFFIISLQIFNHYNFPPLSFFSTCCINFPIPTINDSLLLLSSLNVKTAAYIILACFLTIQPQSLPGTTSKKSLHHIINNLQTTFLISPMITNFYFKNSTSPFHQFSIVVITYIIIPLPFPIHIYILVLISLFTTPFNFSTPQTLPKSSLLHPFHSSAPVTLPFSEHPSLSPTKYPSPLLLKTTLLKFNLLHSKLMKFSLFSFKLQAPP